MCMCLCILLCEVFDIAAYLDIITITVIHNTYGSTNYELILKTVCLNLADLVKRLHLQREVNSLLNNYWTGCLYIYDIKNEQFATTASSIQTSTKLYIK